jgi:hypothetical protein
MIARIVLSLLLVSPALCTAQNTTLTEKLIADSPWVLTIEPSGGGSAVVTRLPFRRTPEGGLEVRVSSTEWRTAEVPDGKTVRFTSRRGHLVVVTQNAAGEISATHANSRNTTFHPAK